jgi:hypothetical protein
MKCLIITFAFIATIACTSLLGVVTQTALARLAQAITIAVTVQKVEALVAFADKHIILQPNSLK